MSVVGACVTDDRHAVSSTVPNLPTPRIKKHRGKSRSYKTSFDVSHHHDEGALGFNQRDQSNRL